MHDNKINNYTHWFYDLSVKLKHWPLKKYLDINKQIKYEKIYSRLKTRAVINYRCEIHR
jgi:hypothetical protein